MLRMIGAICLLCLFAFNFTLTIYEMEKFDVKRLRIKPSGEPRYAGYCVWDVILCSLVGVLMLTRNMLPTAFSVTLAHFYITFHPSRWTSVITTGQHIHGANISSNFLV
jgi:hypothetical protein